jgi:hypothetical protein
MLGKIGKLKGRSHRELKARAGQALAAFAERRGWSEQSRLPSDTALLNLLEPGEFQGVAPSIENLLEHFRDRTEPRFFASFDDRRTMQSELLSRFGAQHQQTLIERADKIVEGRFQLLGFSDLHFGEPIDWHLEPVSRKRSPLIHWSSIAEVDASDSGDKKIVWELNRHQYFATLGRAFLLTGDQRYAQTFATHLSHWMNENPPGMGLNWVSSLEVAFRAISWIWGFHFFKSSRHLSPALFARALKFLYLHARHLETYLSTYSSPNTHLTGEALGLFYLGTLLPEFRSAQRWREMGRQILLDEIDRHVLNDGVYFERTSYYHRYTTDFYTHFLILAERNGQTVPDSMKAKLQSLLEHLMFITRPDGTTPFIGDDDGGRLVMLDERAANNFRATLSNGAALFDRSDFKWVAGEAAEETFWLLGRDGLQKFEQLESNPPSQLSRGFADGGYYVMRDGWIDDSNFLLIDAGPHGSLGCGHAHADALAFELAARGRTMLVDPGTFTYTGSSELRDYFRSTAAHNSLTIDRESSSVSDGPFSWKRTADAYAKSWKPAERFDFFEGAHDGYSQLGSSAAKHVRSVLFLKDDYWILRDRVETEGSHRYEANFHFAASAEPLWNGASSSIDELPSGDAGIQIFTIRAGGEWRMEDGWVSTCYGMRTSAPVGRCSFDGTGSQELCTFIIPRRVKDAPARVRELEATGGRAFEIRVDGFRDVLLFGDGSMVEAEGIATDSKWCWMRFSEAEVSEGWEMSKTADESGVLEGAAFALKEIVLIDGGRLKLNDDVIVDLPKRAETIVGHRVGEALRFESAEVSWDVWVSAQEELVPATPGIPGFEISNLKSEI